MEIEIDENERGGGVTPARGAVDTCSVVSAMKFRAIGRNGRHPNNSDFTEGRQESGKFNLLKIGVQSPARDTPLTPLSRWVFRNHLRSG
ncbi:MAG: hypothetical protein CMJ46_11290 [Planctomyces sp.]|nr:hypothetical protein [Planctomyces sp.]